jgi:hypothetical protein
MVTYGHGFIRRGLLGTLLSAVIDQNNLAAVGTASVVLRIAASLALIAGVAYWLWRLLIAGRNARLLICVFALFATSQLPPLLGFDPDFLDVYDYLLVLFAAFALMRDAPWIAALIGFAAPFLHEAAIFPWSILILLELWRRKPRNVAWLLTPILSTGICYFAASSSNAAAELATLPLPDDFKHFATMTMFGQTFWQNLSIMWWKHTSYPLNVAMAWAFYAAPAALAVVLYGSMRRKDWMVLVLCTLAPACVLAVGGWEISRFTSATAFSALLTIFYMETFDPVSAGASAWLVAGYALAVVNFFIPATLAYFEQAIIVDRGPFMVTGLEPFGSLTTRAVRYYNRFIAPDNLTLAATGQAKANTWFESEDGWEGVWVRRPGTDIFDGYSCKQIMCAVNTQVIHEDGDRIVATRLGPSGAPEYKLIGMVHGDEVQGTYRGGRWFAMITDQLDATEVIRRLIRDHGVPRLCYTEGRCFEGSQGEVP